MCDTFITPQALKQVLSEQKAALKMNAAKDKAATLKAAEKALKSKSKELKELSQQLEERTCQAEQVDTPSSCLIGSRSRWKPPPLV